MVDVRDDRDIAEIHKGTRLGSAAYIEAVSARQPPWRRWQKGPKMLEKPVLAGRTDVRAFRRNRNAPKKAELVDYLNGPVNAAGLLAEMDLSGPETPAALPKHIWMYWHDGWENAPDIAKLCLQSWIRRNPGYEVHALDYRMLGEFLTDPPEHDGKTKLSGFSDLVRLRLLRNLGGVWADATLFCAQPIESWIEDETYPTGFFAFTLSRADRPISTWFLAAIPQSPLITAWDAVMTAYFQNIVREGRTPHAYLFVHYVFEFVLAQSPQLRAQWDAMPKTLADAGRVAALANLQNLGEIERVGPGKWKRIAEALTESRMQKLTWKGAIQTKEPRALRVLKMLRANLDAAP
jgi:hypothetical protein